MVELTRRDNIVQAPRFRVYSATLSVVTAIPRPDYACSERRIRTGLFMPENSGLGTMPDS